MRKEITSKLLQTIKIVACVDGVIYGIPYLMREGQSPKDIKDKYRGDWVYLRNMSGFYGDKNKEELEAVKAFLAFTGVPSYSGEWFEVEWFCPVCGDSEWLIPFCKDGLYMTGCMACKAEFANSYQLLENKKLIENNNWSKAFGIGKI